MSDSTETPGLTEAREALRAYDARDRSQDEGNGASCVVCFASLYLNDDCEWPEDGPHCATCESDERGAFVGHARATLAEVERLTADANQLDRHVGALAELTGKPRESRALLLVLARNAIKRVSTISRALGVTMDDVIAGAAVEQAVDRLTRERDAALAALAALRIEHEAVCGLLAHTRRDRDEARARVAELEARPTFEAGVRAAAKALRDADDSRGSVALYGARRTILALLEPKP